MDAKRTRIAQLLAAQYIAVLLCFSFPFLSNRSFWLDEVFTWEMVKGSWGEVFARTAQDVHPPLYYLILKLFCSLFGYHELVFRLVSFLPAVILAFAAVFSLLPRLGTLPAVYFMTCTALMPYAMRTNAEARMYSWAFLFVTLCGYGLYLILQVGRRRDWVLFTAMGIGAAWTHYFAFLAIAVLYLALLVFLLARRQSVRGWLCCFGVSVLCYLPWLGVFLSTFTRTAGSFWLTAVPALHDTLALLYSDHISGWLLLGLSALLLAWFLLRRPAGCPAAVCLAAASLGCAAAVLGVGYGVSALVRPLFLSRYFYPVCGLLWLCTGMAAQALVRRLRIPSPAGLLLVLAALYCAWKPYCEEASTNLERSGWIDDSVAYVEQTAEPGARLTSSVGMDLREATLEIYFPGWDITAYDSAGGWIPQDGHSVFLFTPELGYLQEDAQAAADAAGYTVESSRGVCLGAGYFTAYHLVPGGA